jgi:hypothetical protein
VHGSLAPFALLPDGDAVVFLSDEDLHVQARHGVCAVAPALSALC